MLPSKFDLLLLLLLSLSGVVVNSQARTGKKPLASIQDDFLSPKQAFQMGVLAQVVYELDAKRGNISTFQQLVPDGYEILGYVDQGSTEVLVLRENGDGDDRIIVSFRGSEEIADWIVNVGQVQVPFGYPNRTIAYKMYQPGPDGNAQELEIRVHRGFNQVFRVYDQVLELISTLVSERGKVWFTGHSLGGANAQLFATHYAFTHPQTLVYLTTFGSPRCGNRGFKIFSESIRNYNMWRIVNNRDAVPRVPFQDYEHAGHLMARRYPDLSVHAFYRQIGSTSLKLAGSQDFGVALLRSENVPVLIADHMMSNYMDWLEAAVFHPTVNFTSSFKKSRGS